MKKFLSLVLALVMTMSLVTVSAGAKDFTDSSKINYSEAVDVMSAVKVIDGYADGSFNPTATLTRGAAAKIICNLILGPTTASALVADAAPYKDVPTNHTFAGYIAYCQKTGIISGYADGTFKPANTLTGYAFMKMLLGALGYKADVEGYAGANWSINVAKQAINAKLNDGLKGDFNGIKAVTREEACLYAFNTLKATMVEYDTTITIGGVTVAGARADVENTARTETIKDDNKMQFAEKYFTKLSVSPANDVFGRPANKWVNNKDEIGTYVDYTQMVAEYTTEVSGKELYDVIGSTAFKDYDFSSYVDGEHSTLHTEISKNNKGDVSYTGNGALTQVFVNNDTKNGDVTVTVINTYLAQANDDYNAKKDSVSFNVFNVDSNAKASGEDFDVEGIKEDDFVLVTYNKADDEIVDMYDVKTIADTEITSFKAGKSGNLTVGGTKYEYNKTANYDAKVLDDYTGITNNGANLKDVTYNVYLDQYGYVIGVEEVSAPKDYVFITGADDASSNLTNKTWSANAIFMDGTSKVIDVKSTSITTAAPIINKWYKYTVSNSGVYTLDLVNETVALTGQKTETIAQKHNTEGDVSKIDDKHISMKGIGADARVYGNDNTVYLLAELDKVTKKDAKGLDADYTVITGVDEVVTGVDNAAFTVYGWTAARAEVKATQGTASDETVSYGVYPLYKDNGYIAAAVVVGESSTVSNSVAYVHTSKISSESYNKTTGEWTWTRDVIINGQEVELVETNDDGVSALKNDADMRQYNWVRVKYYADGTVKEIESYRDAGKFVTTIEDAVKRILADEDFIVLDTNSDNKKVAVDGKTLYDVTNRETGFRVAEDVKVVLTQTNKNKSTTTYEQGINALKSTLADLNEGTAKYWFDAVIENGRATVVIIDDRNEDKNYDKPDGSTNTDAIEVTVGMDVSYVIKDSKATAADLAAAIVEAMNKDGYTQVTVDLKTKTVTAQKSGQELVLNIVDKTPTNP